MIDDRTVIDYRFASENIGVSGKQNGLFPWGPVIKCMLYHSLPLKKDLDPKRKVEKFCYNVERSRPVCVLNVKSHSISKITQIVKESDIGSYVGFFLKPR